MHIYEIAELIRSERKKKGWTQAELGRRSGVSRQLVSEFENGNLDEIGFKKMGRMCVDLKLEITVAPIDPGRHAEVEAIGDFCSSVPMPQVVGHTASPSGVRQKGKSYCIDGAQTCYALVEKDGAIIMREA